MLDNWYQGMTNAHLESDLPKQNLWLTDQDKSYIMYRAHSSEISAES